MRAEIDSVYASGKARRESLSSTWRRLCADYLPVVPQDSIWRFSRAPTCADPEQGWKLHVSATILTANEVLERVAPFLRRRGVLFKGPATLQELEKINSGLYHGYSQIGKFITVYPQSPEEARVVAGRLHALTLHIPAPPVPFDLRFSADSNVYYRYGAFIPLQIKHPDGTSTYAVRDPEGELVPDLRESAEARPPWVRDPLFVEPPPQPPPTTTPPTAQQQSPPSADARAPESPLRTTFRAFRALTQRGKGGVYHAVDVSAQPPRPCLLKEGRRNGEPVWDGRDGHWRIRQEERALTFLRGRGIDVPSTYAAFETGGNYYLVTEFIEGESLQAILRRMKKRMSVSQALRYALRLATLVSQIHSAGWVWRDCKPSNIMVTKKGGVRPLDFEGACPLDRPDPLPWGTPEFTPPEWNSEAGDEESRAADDLYALGVVMYLLLTGRMPAAAAAAAVAEAPLPMEKLRRNIPPEVRKLVEELLSADPRRRPNAGAVVRMLDSLHAEPVASGGRGERAAGGALPGQ